MPEGKTSFETSTEKIIIGTKSTRLPETLRDFIEDNQPLSNAAQQKWNIFSLKNSHRNAKGFWKIVRDTWTDVLKDKNAVHLRAKAEEQTISQQLARLQAETLTDSQLKEKVLQVLQKSVQPGR